MHSAMAWLETYTYDRNGNRATKTTPWGTVRYEYDAENRLVRKGDAVYTNDMDGNTISEKGLRDEALYEYNGQNRMSYSEITSHVDRTHTVTWYACPRGYSQPASKCLDLNYMEKPLEQEAYTFGPSNPGVSIPQTLSNPILEQDDPYIQRWFR